jgi:hypothetical protein
MQPDISFPTLWSMLCVGYDKAQEFMPDVWKAVVFERFDDYRKEHLNVVL